MELFKLYGKIAVQGVEEAKADINDVTDEAEKSSNKMSKFGSFMKGLGKGVLVATGAVATASVGLIKKVSSNYGALQQSIGGIETLFGKSADKVIQNANNAFTTAGISANDYMQQVTSFSASLLQSLDGDTEKACDSADMAIRDMADNANKMGTSMEMIQNAYQGFSKQNYTMLDNLKLGYGGTKTEMERLLKDAQKITGIKYDISNLNDVYQAIHVIQGELGITGTTAKEAGATIEGSFNSLGASWQNFLAGLGNPDADMKQLVDNLAKGISGAVNNVIPVINNMVQVLPTVMDAIINAVESMLPTLIQTFTELITKVIDAIVKLLPQFIPLAIQCILTVTQALLENLPLIVDAGIQLILGLAKGIGDALPQLLPIIVNVVKEIVNILLNNIGSIIEIGVELILALIQGLTVAIPQLVEMLPEIVDTVVTVLLNNLPLLIDSGFKIIIALGEGLIKAIPSLIKAVPQIIFSLVNSIIGNAPKLLDAGKSLVGGLFTGIKSSFSGILEFFSNMINKIGDMWGKFTSWIKSIFKLPHFTFSGSINPVDWITQGELPRIGVEWYAKGGVMTKPTVFGYNPMTNNAMVGGEREKEAIAPISTLQQYVSDAVRGQNDNMVHYLEKLIDLLSNYLPDIRDKMDRPITFDPNKVVNATARKMDSKLGDIMTTKARFGV